MSGRKNRGNRIGQNCPIWKKEEMANQEKREGDDGQPEKGKKGKDGEGKGGETPGLLLDPRDPAKLQGRIHLFPGHFPMNCLEPPPRNNFLAFPLPFPFQI
ncbi:hypothetical protein ACFX2I_019039 [Malus domestica]